MAEGGKNDLIRHCVQTAIHKRQNQERKQSRGIGELRIT